MVEHSAEARGTVGRYHLEALFSRLTDFRLDPPKVDARGSIPLREAMGRPPESRASGYELEV